MEQTASLAPALERGLAIIEIVASLERPASFTEIVTRSRVPKATANRLLKVLVSTGYLRRSQEGSYEPGAKCNLLGRRCGVLSELESLGPGVVSEIMEKTSNTCVLFYWNGSQTQVVAKAMHESSIAMQPMGNVSNDLEGTPWGWLALAEELEASGERRRYAKLAASSEFKAAIAEAKTRGYIVEASSGPGKVKRLAAPVRAGGRLVAFLALGGTPYTIPASATREAGELLAAHAALLERKLPREAN